MYFQTTLANPWQSDLVLQLQYSSNYTRLVGTFLVICQDSEFWVQRRAASQKRWSGKQVFWLICFKCLNEISATSQSNRVPASATAVHLVHLLTGNGLKCWVHDATAFSCMTCALSFRLHGRLVGAGGVSFRVPHWSPSIQRRDSSAGLPEYSQQRLVYFHLLRQKQLKGGLQSSTWQIPCCQIF